METATTASMLSLRKINLNLPIYQTLCDESRYNCDIPGYH